MKKKEESGELLKEMKCFDCKKKFSPKRSDLTAGQDKILNLCPECQAKKGEWCPRCEGFFEKTHDCFKQKEGSGLSLIQGGEPLTAEEIRKQKSGIIWIRKRTEFLTNEWIKEFEYIPGEKIPPGFKELAQRYADLENDFKFIKETAEFAAMRFAEVQSVFPILREMDELIKLIENHDENDSEFFLIAPKKERLEKLMKLRSAIFALQQQG